MIASNRQHGYVPLADGASLPDDAPTTPGIDAETATFEHTCSTPYGGKLTIHPGGEGYTYAYGPQGLRGLLHNSYTLKCAVFASIGGLTFGYDQGVIANILVMKDFTEKWRIGPWEEGLMTAVLELGCLFGALWSGVFADRFTRRTSIAVASLIFCVGSAIQCWAGSLTMLVVGRAIGGLGVGALSMLSPLFIGEISTPEVRGSLLSLEQFSIVLGCVVGFWTGYGTRNLPGAISWRLPLGLQLVPGVLLGLGAFTLPSSPRLLVYQGKRDEALASLAKLRLRTLEEAETDPLLQIELLEMQVEATLIQQTTGAVGKSSIRNEALAWAKLFSRRYRSQTMVGITVGFFQQWSGINALIYYGPLLMRSLGFDGENINLLVSGGINIVQFIAVLPTILYIDRLGRKPLLRYGSAVTCAAHLTISILVYLWAGHWNEHAMAAWVAVGSVYVFTVAYGLSLGPVAWVLPSEIFPLSMRGRGVALSTASVWLNNFFIGLVTPGLLEVTPAGTFGVFACACFGAYLWSTYVVPETANASLEEIAFRASDATGDDTEHELKKQIERDLGLYDLIRQFGSDSDEEER
ncbi:uncharacterized protein STEHIDRAFT_72465 [Stereum hirsutum FP-91666 SS1]|uniref:uncharacterized protein n=1 Tax=Stereum hirsutum (strain FP-91666) TaxID=721885 RepID=UPI000440BB74|nr:uncharacterized protein STEHIDRAFT_72465 [Stereum hirsutum FP-91666 SS1]EIM90835.1 hypothetical protein STEHIDRAFT_72465 [Stereum hirsutum FP-91666 SS1]